MSIARVPRFASTLLKAFAVVAALSSPAWAVTRVQTVTGTNNNDSTLRAVWPDNTGTGALLVAIVTARGGTGTTFTPPSGKGWTLAVRSNNSTNVATAIYYVSDADAQSGNSDWAVSPNARGSVTLIEYTGAAPSTVLDKTASTSGTGTSASTGSPGATTQASEVAIAAIAVASTDTFSGWNNSFTEVSEVTSTTSSSSSLRTNTAFAERIATATGSMSAGATLSASASWAGAVATFKTAIRYWIGSGSGNGADCANGGNWSLSSGGANNTGAPDAGSIVVFDAGKTTSCTLATSGLVEGLQLASGYTGTITINSGVSLYIRDVTMAGGTFKGAAIVSGALALSGGTWDCNGSSMSVASASTISGTGTYKVGTGTQTFSGGLTVSSGGTLNMTGANGKLKLGAGTTLAVNGALTASGSGATVPRIDSVSGNYAFTAGSTATLSLSGLRIDHVTAAGLAITNSTFSAFKNVQFYNNAGGAGSSHLSITDDALELSAPGCYFDNTAAINVKLTGNGDSDGTTFASFEYRNTTTNGALSGESYDSDDDNSPVDGVGDHPTTNGAVVQWLYSVVSDTSGTAEGFPTAAYDWNTFSWYAVYATYRDTAGASSSDKIYVRNMDGDALYEYAIAQTDGDIIGTPKWDSLSEVTAGMDINGDGDSTDTSVHVLYVATTGGKIYKLIDNGSALVLPGAGSPWSTAFSSASVSSITSPLITDTVNLYFGGKSSTTPKVFGVQISKGANQKVLVKNVTAASQVSVAPAWKIYSGTTYLFLGSTATSGQAYIYKMDVAPGASINATCTDAKHDIGGSVKISFDRAIVGDGGGRLHEVTASVFTSGGFANATGFPFRDTTTHTAAFLDAGSGAIQASPYVDASTGYVYFGDKDGHLYAVTNAGAKVAGFPIRLSTTAQLNSSPIYANGVVLVGSSAGQVFYVDQNAGSSAPATFRTVSFGSGAAISTIAYNSNKNEYMIGTSTGQLFFIDKLTDPTPSSN